MSETRIACTVDYDKPGKQIGWLSLPYSVTRSAYGNIRIPICVARNGEGPTALLMAGNHGDFPGPPNRDDLRSLPDTGLVEMAVSPPVPHLEGKMLENVHLFFHLETEERRLAVHPGGTHRRKAAKQHGSKRNHQEA